MLRAGHFLLTLAVICDKINMQIFEQHPGVVGSASDGTYMIRCREHVIPAKLADTVAEKPQAGSHVQFAWNHNGVPTITKVFRNLLEI